MTPETTENALLEQPLPINNGVEIAKVAGAAITELPKDLYIPPEALRVFLETFEGPLDLLLYLIKKENINIVDIPIAEITRQYMEYIDLMRELEITLAAEYLLMAATLAEIKSRVLLPRIQTDEEGEDDPRAELIRRLREYERFKLAAENISELPRVDRDIHVAQMAAPKLDLKPPPAQVSLEELMVALQNVLVRARLYESHQVRREQLSIRERMTHILDKISQQEYLPFTEFFSAHEGRMGVVVTLIAILELVRQSVIELLQSQAYAPIYVKAKGV